jgi:D-glycero-alpha-D-manno-heptose-7-phosphate kinase
VLNFGIQTYAFARLQRRRDTRAVTIRSLDFEREVKAAAVTELEIDGDLDLLKGLARRLDPPWGFELTVESEAAPGSGLGSSGAVSVAVVAAFVAALGRSLTAVEVADLANRVERHDLGYAGGNQDSYGPALGGVNLLVYHRGGGTEPRRPAVAEATLHELERRGVLVYTGEAHLSGSIHDDIKRSYAMPDSPTVDAMKQLAGIARRSADALERGDVDAFGRLLDENRRHHYRLHESCDSERLRLFYGAVEGEIVGGKTCGAGGGGCILFLAKEGRRRAVEQACRRLGGELIPLRIDRRGITVW